MNGPGLEDTLDTAGDSSHCSFTVVDSEDSATYAEPWRTFPNDYTMDDSSYDGEDDAYCDLTDAMDDDYVPMIDLRTAEENSVENVAGPANVQEEALEENNNDPNNNVDSIEMVVVTSPTSPQEARNFRINSLDSTDEYEEARPMSPKPGCSKNSVLLPEEPPDVAVLLERTRHILGLVSRIHRDSVYDAVMKNHRKPVSQLMFWDLIPESERLEYQDDVMYIATKAGAKNAARTGNAAGGSSKSKRGPDEDICTIGCKRSSSTPDISGSSSMINPGTIPKVPSSSQIALGSEHPTVNHGAIAKLPVEQLRQAPKSAASRSPSPNVAGNIKNPVASVAPNRGAIPKVYTDGHLRYGNQGKGKVLPMAHGSAASSKSSQSAAAASAPNRQPQAQGQSVAATPQIQHSQDRVQVQVPGAATQGIMHPVPTGKYQIPQARLQAINAATQQIQHPQASAQMITGKYQIPQARGQVTGAATQLIRLPVQTVTATQQTQQTHARPLTVAAPQQIQQAHTRPLTVAAPQQLQQAHARAQTVTTLSQQQQQAQKDRFFQEIRKQVAIEQAIRVRNKQQRQNESTMHQQPRPSNSQQHAAANDIQGTVRKAPHETQETREDGITALFAQAKLDRQAQVAAQQAPAAAKSTQPPPPQQSVERAVCMEMYYKLINMFPHVDRNYIKRLCPPEWGPGDRDAQLVPLIDHILDGGENVPILIANENPGAEDASMHTVDDIYENLLGIFPDADPHYLREFAARNVAQPDAVKNFVETKLERRDYPTREQYMARLKITEQQRQYTHGFDIKQYLSIIPDPKKHFRDATRKCEHSLVALEFLKSYFNKMRVTTITRAYLQSRYNLSLTARQLERIGPEMKSRRNNTEMLTEDILLLQEIAFVKHYKEIKAYIADAKKAEEAEFNTLKARNQLLTCQCCFDDECITSKCNPCDNGHIFCNNCIVNGTSAKMGEGQTRIKCFEDCDSEFSLSVLQRVLTPTMFSILLNKRQAAEVIEAGLEGLESCPFCHFASIPPEGDKIFKCLNPECTKESCRLCKELSHVPLKCDEVMKADKARRYVEEKMTEALARKCYKCKKSFFKEEGCNKITCVCGAIMCYLCDQPIKDYKHFRGQGSDAQNLCPLYSDTIRLDAVAVRRVAEQAQLEVLKRNPNVKIDTTSLLPEIPRPRQGPHQDILNADELPRRFVRPLDQPPI